VIKERANGLLSMLHTPSLTNRMDALIERGVITETIRRSEKASLTCTRNVVDFSKEEDLAFPQLPYFHVTVNIQDNWLQRNRIGL